MVRLTDFRVSKFRFGRLVFDLKAKGELLQALGQGLSQGNPRMEMD